MFCVQPQSVCPCWEQRRSLSAAGVGEEMEETEEAVDALLRNSIQRHKSSHGFNNLRFECQKCASLA